MPRSVGTSTGSLPVTSTWPSRSSNVATGSRPTNEKRLQRSPCSTDSSRKPGPSPTSLANAATGVSRSASSSAHTGTTVYCAARARKSSRLGRMRTSRLSSVAEAAVEAGALAGVAGAVAVLLHLEQQHVGVAVVVRLVHDLVVAAGVALAPDLLAAAAPVDHPALVERHPQRLGVHPRQHQHVAVAASWVMTGTSPSSLNVTPSSCSAVGVDRRHRYSPVAASMRSAATAWMSRSRSMM